MSMWVARYGGSATNQFCLIAGPTKEVANNLAVERLKRAEAELDVLVQAARRAENVRSAGRRLFSKELRAKGLASYLSTQVEREVVALDSVLREGLALRFSLDWAKLRDH